MARVYNQYVLVIITYGAESWLLTKKNGKMPSARMTNAVL